MSKIRLETLIKAPLERCFDLSRCVNLHELSAAASKEKAVAGVTRGLLGFQDVVTWEAQHFFITQRLSSKITIYDRPNYFRDSQVEGIFRSFDHDHFFENKNGSTLMRDVLVFECPFGILGQIAEYPVYLHLKNFLKTRNELIKSTAEGDGWRAFI